MKFSEEEIKGFGNSQTVGHRTIARLMEATNEAEQRLDAMEKHIHHTEHQDYVSLPEFPAPEAKEPEAVEVPFISDNEACLILGTLIIDKHRHIWYGEENICAIKKAVRKYSR